MTRPHGHIQAVGVDGVGRRRYLYHRRWRQGPRRGGGAADARSGVLRIGAEENGSRGVATLRREHVKVRGDEVRLGLPAKTVIGRTLEIEDWALAAALRSLLRADAPASGRLLV
ncbi:hypothetical protein EEB14_28370 [Rhodococcus sp. WS4]|nr:hypothetical protein EEB14_28370 [Rhodococcus sp. WS4]